MCERSQKDLYFAVVSLELAERVHLQIPLAGVDPSGDALL